MVVIIDAGSNQFEEHKYFYDNGIDVCCIDHHEAFIEKDYQKAVVINNNADYESIGNPYPTKSLCGTAMAYKFCCRIDELMGTEYAQNYRDMVALAEIADMMSLRDFETIELVRQGLENIRNPFFMEMLEKNKSRFTNGITISSVAFYIVPYINAVSRVATRDERLLMFEGMLEYKANNLIPSTKRGHKGEEERLVEQAVRLCVNLKQTKQTGALNSGYEKAENLITENNLLNDKFIIVQYDKGSEDSEIKGLIANKLMAKYQRPVLVLSYKDGLWSGSGRGYEKGGLVSFKDFLADSGLVEMVQGHANAFGFSIKEENIPKLKDYAKIELKDIEFSPSYNVDFIWDVNNINDCDIYDIADFNYLWGQQVEEPLVAIENVKINANSLSFLGATGTTMKISAGDLSFIKFNMKDEDKILLDPGEGYYTMDIVGRCNRNVYNETCTPQIQVEDYRIRNRVSYYF